MSLRLESRLSPFLLWPNWLWIFILAETFLALWARVVNVPPGGLIGLHLRAQWILFGFPHGQVGVMPTMIVVNVVVVIGLWASYRSARALHRRFFLPLAATTLAGAVVLALISWSAVNLSRVYPPLKVGVVLELDGTGDYRLREFASR